jgi:2-polyprenyl-6-hydroxyphenyl methylase/3-demethylubiquinone-9 3-methyltransferase
MAVDNEIYNRMSETWWDEKGFLNNLLAYNPVRFGYFRKVLFDKLKIELNGRRALDIGCGGGILAEEFARVGYKVTGIDPSEPSLEEARKHAKKVGLDIEYNLGFGEDIPFDDETFDMVYTCDVLEHVTNLEKVINETARVLKPDGIYLYDTFNRTFLSKLIMIKLLQEWRWTSFIPPNCHDWNMFIKPEELLELLARYGFENQEQIGIKPGVNPLKIIQTVRKRKRGEISYFEVVQRMKFRESGDKSMAYTGYALKKFRGEN